MCACVSSLLELVGYIAGVFIFIFHLNGARKYVNIHLVLISLLEQDLC